jgi:CBS domain-containing protein
MKLEQFMTRNVETIAPEDSLCSAAKKMRDHNIGFLPVELNGSLVGVITDRDITTRSTAAGNDPQLTSVGEIMTSDVVTCYQDQSAESAAEVMNMHQIRRLIVVDKNKAVVGVVSLGDLAVDAINNEQAGEVLKNVSYPAKPEKV